MQSEWVICKVFMKKPPSDHRKLEMLELEQEEAGHTSPGHRLPPMVPDGCDGGEEEEAPPILFDPWHTNCDAGEEEHMVHREELPLLIMNRSSCASPYWLLHDDHQLGAYCSTWRMIMHQRSSAPDDLPELLEYGGHDLPKRSASQDTGLTGGEADHRAQISPASVASLHLDESYWNFGF